jgi:hypothetical protein
MSIEFHDSQNECEHSNFQRWRRENENGFFVNVKSENNLMLHKADCKHLGDAIWEKDDSEAFGSLTKTRKICSNNSNDLQDKIRKEFSSVKLKFCNDCKPI